MATYSYGSSDSAVRVLCEHDSDAGAEREAIITAGERLRDLGWSATDPRSLGISVYRADGTMLLEIEVRLRRGVAGSA